jgi:hypothetical protein
MPRSTSTNYNGNPKLKGEGVKQDFTLEQLQEYRRCAEDPVYFIRSYVKIVNVDKGVIPFRLYPFQEEMVKLFRENRFSICKIGRQSGKSTTTCAFLLHTILFNEEQNICILANKFATAKKLLSDLKKSYMLLPKWLQQGVVEWNKQNIALENGCKILASSTSSDAIRGNAFNILFLDEFAFVPAHIAEEFFDSVYPTISSGKTTKVIIVSTPKGHNKFYKMWSEANIARDNTDPERQWNGYVPFAVNWRHVPGRDEKWRRETVARVGEQSFTQEFECEFIGSSDTLISADRLKVMTWKRPVAVKRLKFDHVVLDVHSYPEDRHAYALVADVAGGRGGDYSAFTITDITQFPYRVVAKYRSNTVKPLLFADVIYEAAVYFNNAVVLVETNDLGSQVANCLHQDLEYEFLISTTVKGQSGPQVGGGFGKNAEFGLRTNKATKKIGCTNLKQMIETEKLLVEDFQIVHELTRFVANTKGSYSAEEGSNDDLVMTLVNFAWLVNQTYFKDLTETDIYRKLKEDFEQGYEEDLLPFGFHSNGLESFDDDDGLRL